MGGKFGKGGGGGVTTVVQKHYVQDPALIKQIQTSRQEVSRLTELVSKLQKQLAEAMEVAKKQKDPKLYRQLKDKAFTMFVENIQTLKFEEKIPKQTGQKHYVLIGNIASGKSSLINDACGTNLAVGLGETTLEIRKVAQSPDKRVNIWDSPGVNEDFTFYDTETLAYFHSADKIFILYPDSLKSSKDMIRVLYAIKPNNTYLVRTMCDRWQAGFSKTIAQELQTDRALLNQWNIEMEVLATSTKKGDEFLDNLKFKRLLKGEI